MHTHTHTNAHTYLKRHTRRPSIYSRKRQGPWGCRGPRCPAVRDIVGSSSLAADWACWAVPAALGSSGELRATGRRETPPATPCRRRHCRCAQACADHPAPQPPVLSWRFPMVHRHYRCRSAQQLSTSLAYSPATSSAVASCSSRSIPRQKRL